MGAGLLVAAGGGGDAIAAVMVARMLEVGERHTVTLTRFVITGGNATVKVGGGIQNGGALTLNRTAS